MTVYAMAGEADSFSLGTSMAYAHETTSGRYESNLSRGAMIVTQGASEIYVPFGTTLSDFWIHFRLYQEGAPASTESYFYIKNAAGTEDEYRIQINSDSTWTIQRFKSATYTTLGTTSSAVLLDAAGDIDIHVVRNISSGVFQIYKNGVSVFNFTGDTDTTSVPGMIYFEGMTTSTREMDISQVVVADESTIGWKVATLSPTGNGANTAWTNDYLNVDEFVYDNTDFIETNSVGVIETYTTSGINAAYSTYNVKAVAVAARMSNDSGSSVADVQFVVRVSGTNYTSPNAGLTKDGNEYSKQYIWNTNPNTSSAWSQAQVNGAEIGVKSV